MAKFGSLESDYADHPSLLLLRTTHDGRIAGHNGVLLEKLGLQQAVLGRDAIDLVVPAQRRAETRTNLAQALQDRAYLLQVSLLGDQLEVAAEQGGPVVHLPVTWHSQVIEGPNGIMIDNMGILHSDALVEEEKLEIARDIILEALVKRLEQKDNETKGHSHRVAEMTVMLAQAMGLADKDLTDIRRGALLHDIGKLGIPEEILKKQGKLTDEERRAVEKHPVIGYEMLQGIPYLEGPRKIVLYHHERIDGKGYPYGLRGNEIPLFAQIFQVVDAWDAMTANRVYRPGMSFRDAITELRAAAGTQLNAAIVEKFLEFRVHERIRHGLANIPELAHQKEFPPNQRESLY